MKIAYISALLLLNNFSTCLKLNFIDEKANSLTWKELKGDEIKDDSEWHEDFEKRWKDPDYGSDDNVK